MGRNLILLSDGTGNSARALSKSNVWRLYQALDLGDGQQIAFYDAGVGTSGFKPLMILGGAFGWGLSRNVRQMYEFLCRHYADGDKIYIFGFSRGAFTARVLAHFITVCGIINRDKKTPGARFLRYKFKAVPMNRDEGLRRGVRSAYKSYRRYYWDNATPFLKVVSTPFRWVRNLLFNDVVMPVTFREKYCRKSSDGERIKVEFIGAWDTVDAVGLPIDEMSELLNDYIYPYKFPDQDLSPWIRRACHAVAIDDERQTFHPVLWNESGIRDSERLTQVWFVGKHANVGGSYPDDDLAHITLEWMIGEAASGGGLKFNSDRVKAISLRAQPLGKLYDSRQGASRYYRYKPRRIDDLCWDADNHVYIREPKIHHSVFDRIAASTVGYAPAGLPTSYRVVARDGAIGALNASDYETKDQREKRGEYLARTRNHVFQRRVAYFAFLFLTLCLVALPLFKPAIPGVEPRQSMPPPDWSSGLPDAVGASIAHLLAALEGFYVWVFKIAALFLPDFTNRWTDAWAQSAGWFTLFVLGLIGLLLWSRRIIWSTQRLAEAGWWHVKKLDLAQRYEGGPSRLERAVARWRAKRWTGQLHRFLVKRLVPIGFAVLCLYLFAGLAYRVSVHYPFVADGVCVKPSAQQANALSGVTVIGGPGAKKIYTTSFDAKTPCHNTGLMLQAGQTYTVKVDWNPYWEDLSVRARPDGFESIASNFHPIFLTFLPARRHLTMPWFTLIGEIGKDSGNLYAFNRDEFKFTPKHSGLLYLYVNDSINATGFPVPVNRAGTITLDKWWANYHNNVGTAEITLTSDG